jgi:hypothetical protein
LQSDAVKDLRQVYARIFVGVELRVVLGIFVQDVIAGRIEGVLQELGVHALGIGGVSDASRSPAAVNTGHIVPGDGAPVCLFGRVVHPSFNPRKEPLRPGTIAIHGVERLREGSSGTHVS